MAKLPAVSGSSGRLVVERLKSERAEANHPGAVFADEARQMLWIADAYNHKIRGYNLKTQVLSTLPMSQSIQNPCALVADAESLWIADSAGSHICRYFFDTEYLSRLSIQMA